MKDEANGVASPGDLASVRHPDSQRQMMILGQMGSRQYETVQCETKRSTVVI
jgi:hypothetical protein